MAFGVSKGAVFDEGEAAARGGVRKEEKKWRVTIVRLGRGRYDESKGCQ